MNWNFLGIALWVITIIWLLFVIKDIRKRHIMMILKEHKRFSAKTMLIDLLEILVFVCAAGFLTYQLLFNPVSLADSKRIDSKVTYEPLILNVGQKNSYYVSVKQAKGNSTWQTYSMYVDGKKVVVESTNSVVSYDQNPLALQAQAIPFSKQALDKADAKYQKAYLASYTATYQNTWLNGLGLHAGNTAVRYYLIRVPNITFIKR